MEKQPVDDLFARKLRQAEVSVNPDAFAQLQQRMGVKEIPQRKVSPLWRYAAAACFMGALAVGYVASTNEEATIVGQSRTTRRVGELHQRITRTGKTKPARINDTDSKEPTTTDKSAMPENRYVHSDRVLNGHRTPEVVETPLPSGIQSVEKVVDVVAIEPQVRHESLPAHPQLALINQPVTVAPIQKSATDRTIILTIDEPELVADQSIKKKNSPADDVRPHGFSGLLGKLRQLKNGETFARATPGETQGSATPSLGRTLTDLKESLKNETTLDQ